VAQPDGQVQAARRRHSHSTWLDGADLSKVIQMDRRGHAMSGMDAVYLHITLAQRYELSTSSAVPLLDERLAEYGPRRWPRIIRTPEISGCGAVRAEPYKRHHELVRLRERRLGHYRERIVARLHTLPSLLQCGGEGS
jgi:hypothetical protein